MIRNARVNDVDELNKLISYFAKKDFILPKSISELYENIRDFYVYVDNGNIVGCAALHVYRNDLAEIKSLAIDENHQKKGAGRKLIQKCFEEGKTLGINQLFVLTHIPEYFENMGFKRVDKGLFPQKIWSECIICHKYNNCEGVSLTIKL